MGRRNGGFFDYSTSIARNLERDQLFHDGGEEFSECVPSYLLAPWVFRSDAQVPFVFSFFVSVTLQCCLLLSFTHDSQIPDPERNSLCKGTNCDSQQMDVFVVNMQMSFHCARARSPRKFGGFLSFEFYSLFSMLCFCVHLRFKIDFSSVVFVFPLNPKNSS